MVHRFRSSVAFAAVAVLLLASCNGSDDDGGGGDGGTNEAVGNFDLLMAATYGDPSTGSYDPSVFDTDEVRSWRARNAISNDAAMSPPNGFGHCMNGGMADPAAVYSLKRIYVLTKDGIDVLGSGTPEGETLAANLDNLRSQQDVDTGERDEEGPFSVQPIELFYAEEPTEGEFVSQVNFLLQGIDPDSVDVALDYQLAPSMIYGFAADDPTPAPADAESAAFKEAADAAASTGEGHTIWVADYGLPVNADESNWPGNIDGDRSQSVPSSVEVVTPHYGHGLMVASAAAQIAVDNPVMVLDATNDVFGTLAITVSGLDASLLRNEVLDSEGVLNLSFGAYDCEVVKAADTGEELAVSTDNRFWAAMEAVLRPYIDKLPVVAAAGNDATSALVYPAQLDGVIGVGAIDTTVINTEVCLDPADVEAWTPADAVDPSCQPNPPGDLAPFSNNGPYVDVTRPGVDLIVHYPLVDPAIAYSYYRYGANPVDLDTGKVRASGTSLAAPFHAACLLPDGSDRC